MTYIRPASQRRERIGGEGPTRAEELADYQDDAAAARRDAALAELRADLVAVQAKVLAAHRSVANLIDAVHGMETAIADVDFELERA